MILLFGFVVSSINLNEEVVEEVVDGVVEDVDDDGATLPIKFCSRGQQTLGTLVVNPQEYCDRNFTLSLEFWLSNRVAEKYGLYYLIQGFQ